MKLIVGLGNPGRLYIDSRHNIGASAARALAKDYRGVFQRDRQASALIARIKLDSQELIIALPLTYMNLSGAAVSYLIKRYKIELEDLLVICDDLDLELGRMKIKPGGSSGGHKGLVSIIAALGSQKFSRLRIGIGRPSPETDIPGYVLRAFNKKERIKIESILHLACICCQRWANEGIVVSMNLCNKKAGNQLMKGRKEDE